MTEIKTSDNPKEVLRIVAQELTTNPELWGQRSYGVTAKGNNSDRHGDIVERMKDPNLCCFCAVGLVARHSEDFGTYMKAVDILAKTVRPDQYRPEPGVILNWNDDRMRLVTEVADTFCRAGQEQ